MPDSSDTSCKPRVLLLTGTPPGKGNVGEIILRDLVLHYGSAFVSCVAVVDSSYAWQPDPALQCMEVQVIRSSQVNARRKGRGKYGAIGSLWHTLTGFRSEVDWVAEKIVKQARAEPIDRVFAVLNNSTMMALAHRVSTALGRPLATLIWDPPDYVLRQSRFDRFSRMLLLNEFYASLAKSEKVGVVSDSMIEFYATRTQASIHILRHGLPMDFGAEVQGPPPKGEDWIIGFAGSMYAGCTWNAFLHALDKVGWRLAGRAVRLRVLTSSIVIKSRRAANIEFLGYRGTEETQELLRQCHLTYLPQPFSDDLRDLCRFSFPTKLTNYLALGKPVFVHCPSDSALSIFFDTQPFGAKSNELDLDHTIRALESLLVNSQSYTKAAECARKVACSEFDSKVFFNAIDQLLLPLPKQFRRKDEKTKSAAGVVAS